LALPRRRFDEAAARLSRALELAVERKCGQLAKARLSPAALERRVREARLRLTRDGEQLPKCAAAFLKARRGAFREASGRLRIEPVAAHLRSDAAKLASLDQRAEAAFIN